MAKENEHEFDEEEWQASGAGGPSFEFEEATGEPQFEPRDADRGAAESSGYERAWREAEPPRASYSAHARRPGRPDAEERQWAMIGHAAGAASLVVTGGTAGWLVPLIIWLIRRDQGGFAAEQAKEALNFQITTFLLVLIALPLMCIAVGFLIIWAIPICSLIFSIIGAVRTWEGEAYDYPINFRIL